MENGERTIFDLFSGEKHFLIPKYQRAYAWEDKQRNDFLEDIRNQREDKQYFLGTILFQDNKEIHDGFAQIYIVDGQQRMTIIIIFMRVLLTLLETKDKSKDYAREIRRYLKDKDVYKLEIMYMDNEFFKTYIIDDNPFEHSLFRTPSQKRLYFTKEFFYSELNKLEVDTLRSYMKKIEMSRVLTYSVNDTAEATLIFETTNDRGKALTNLEKTKSFLMHKIYLTKEKPSELINSIQDRFSEIYRILEEIEDKIEGEDSILQYHFISHFDWKYSQKTKDYQFYVEKMKVNINQMMKNEKVGETAQFIDKYSRELKETFNVVKDIVNNKQTYIRGVFILGRTSNFYPLLIKCYKLDKSNSKNDYYDVVRLLEIFSFRVYGIARKPPYTGRDWLYTLARDFNGDFNELKICIKDNIIKNVNDKSFKEKLSSPYLYKDVRTLDLKYLLWKYENYLRTSEQPKAGDMPEENFLTQNPKFKLTVEHVASQNPKVCTSNLKLPDIDDEFQETYLHRLGNLTFDPNSANASKGNQDIEVKNSKYFVKAPFKIQNELDNFIVVNKWTRESILNRENKILSFALDYWNPKNIITHEIKEEKAPETEISESKYEHKEIFKNIVEALNNKFTSWNMTSQVKKEHDFELYQRRDGYQTTFSIKWKYDNAKFYIEGGINKEENEPHYYFIEFYTVNKSDKINYNLETPEVIEILAREGYENETETEGKPYFIKRLLVENENEDNLTKQFLEEIEKLKPIIERILN